MPRTYCEALKSTKHNDPSRPIAGLQFIFADSQIDALGLRDGHRYDIMLSATIVAGGRSIIVSRYSCNSLLF